MKPSVGITAGAPLLSGALFALEYGPLCRAAGLFRGAPSGAVLGFAQGLAAAGAFTAATTATASRPGLTMLTGVVAGHALLGAVVGFLGAAHEKRDRFVSPRFLAWLKRQEDDDQASLETEGARPPLQIATRQAQRRPAAPDTQASTPDSRAA